MKEKDFEANFQMAIFMFATKLQSVMEDSSEVLAEKVANNVTSDDNFGIEEMAKEVARHVVSELSKEFGLQEVLNETRS